MARLSQHISAAKHNAEVCRHVASKPGQHDWVTTVAFYQALHVVEAVLAQCGKHCPNHDGRATILRKEKRFEKIYECYSELQRLATVARYLHDDGTPFSSVMSPAMVKMHVIDHLLHQVIVSSTKQMSGDAVGQMAELDHFRKLEVN